jgi:cysteine desulfuration protein SufE
MTISQLQSDITNKFLILNDWDDKYQLVINIGKSLSTYPKEFKTDQYIIKGCQSKVWLKAEFIESRIIFNADSDTALIKGMIAILIRVLSNHSPNEIIGADFKFLDEIGLKDFLAPTRSNGLVSMVNQIKTIALQHSN